MKRIPILLVVMILAVMAVGCSSMKDVAYLQDVTPGQSVQVSQQSRIVAYPGDRLQIIVSCSDPQTSALFALLQPSMKLMAGETNEANSDSYMSSYRVDEKGDIDFPILGDIHVGGKSALQISYMIKDALVSKQLVKDPVVQASFTNLHYSVTGEVKNPGQYDIINDRVTLLDALAKAGDLTIYGKRENVKVIREVNGLRQTYVVDLRSDKLFDSPAYYLQQNDIVYVEPNSTRSGQRSVNENNWKSVGLWMSMASFLTSIAVLVFK